jgi:putative PIG3 family NAD(P)H quinone oxidoreductase
VIAAVIRAGALELVERPTPEPAGDQVLVEVAGTGVNRADLLQLRGHYPAPPGWPADVPGLEFSGRVAAVGSRVHSLSAGDEVFGIVGGGGHASHVLVPESLCARVPRGLDLVEAGGVPEVFVTAHDALVTQAGLRAGERVLIHGAGSGVGTAAVQIAHALGATTIGTARTPEKLERVKELGLDEAVLAAPDMAAEIGEVDVVIDLIGGDYLRTDVKVSRYQGRIVIVGLLAGPAAELDMRRLMSKRLTVTGTTLRMRAEWQKAQATARFEREVVPLFERGALRPVIDRLVPIAQITTAYQALERNETFGKLVLFFSTPVSRG